MYKILLKLQKKTVFIKPIYLFEFEYFLLLLAFNSHSELRGFAAAINGTPSCRAVLERSRKVKDRNVKHTHTHARVCTHARTFTRTRVWSPKHWDLDALTPIWSRGHPCVEINERPSGGICLSGKFIFLWSLRAFGTRLRNDRFTSTRTRFTWCARASHFFHCCNRCKKLCAVVLHKTVCEGYHNQKKKKRRKFQGGRRRFIYPACKCQSCRCL